MSQHKSTRVLHETRSTRSIDEPLPVNPTVMRASTLVYQNVAHWQAVRNARSTEQMLSYGARGTSTTLALEDALCSLESGDRAQLYPTGLAAIAGVLIALLKPGEHLLLSDAVYTPTRHLVQELLMPLGIECEFYAADGHDLADRLRTNTRVIYAELPGSLLFEMLDFDQLVALAQSVGAMVVTDNTWASGWLFNPLQHGADVSILAVTKYIGGHSDLVLGAAVCTQAAYRQIGRIGGLLGQTCSPDDASLALRGLRTLDTRLQRHDDNARTVAKWLQTQPQVKRVYCPMLPEHPGHDLWKRDFSGGNGLLTIEFHDSSIERRNQFIDALKLFCIGASWGSFESLSLPVDPAQTRSVSNGQNQGAFVRLHVGLEATVDLIADLKQAMPV